MNTDLLLWGVRAIIITVGIVMLVKMGKWKREGKLKERFHIYLLVLGVTVLVLGSFLLIVSLATNLSSFYGFYLGGVGIVCLVIGLIMRRITVKNRTEV